MSQYTYLYNLIRQWAIDRNLHLGATYESQQCKLWEEFGELVEAFNKKKTDRIKDEIGDVFVVAVVLNVICEFMDAHGYYAEDPNDMPTNNWEVFPEDTAQQVLLSIPEVLLEESAMYGLLHTAEILEKFAAKMDLDFLDCVQFAYDKIKDRKGKMIDGVFIKEADLAKVRRTCNAICL